MRYFGSFNGPAGGLSCRVSPDGGGTGARVTWFSTDGRGESQMYFCRGTFDCKEMIEFK